MEERPTSNQFFTRDVRITTMAAVSVKPKAFRKKYRERTRALIELAASLPDRPSPDQIHDLRVDIRRVQMARRLLRRSVRGSETARQYDQALKSVLRATSQLRDLDTLEDTLEYHKTGLTKDMLVTLENKRSDAAAGAKAAIEVLSDVTAPDLDDHSLSKKKLSRRLDRRVTRRVQVVGELLNKVVEDESKADELHTLRKEVKKLRYLLELADNRQDGLRGLTGWQESLGAIHDLDVAVAFLESTEGEFRGKAIRELQRARHSHYVKFVRAYSKDPMRLLGEAATFSLRPTDSGLSSEVQP